jgi:hypothetical protein
MQALYPCLPFDYVRIPELLSDHNLNLLQEMRSLSLSRKPDRYRRAPQLAVE